MNAFDLNLDLKLYTLFISNTEKSPSLMYRAPQSVISNRLCSLEFIPEYVLAKCIAVNCFLKRILNTQQ